MIAAVTVSPEHRTVGGESEVGHSFFFCFFLKEGSVGGTPINYMFAAMYRKQNYLLSV